MQIGVMYEKLNEIRRLADYVQHKCAYLDKYSSKGECYAVYRQIDDLQARFVFAFNNRSSRICGVRHEINSIRHALIQWIRYDMLYERKVIRRLSRLLS